MPIEPVEAPVPAPRETPRAPAKTVMLRVTTEPSNATVVLDGERLGRTPLVMNVERSDESVVLKVRKRGYRTKKKKIALDGDVLWDLHLSRRR